MQTGTPAHESGAAPDDRVVETEVETVRKRQRVVGAPADGTQTTGAVSPDSGGRYFETLPERMSAVLVVILVALEGLLAIRFLLRAYAANPSSGFVKFIVNVSRPFMRPFADVFNNRSWDQGTLEISTLVAMGFYLLLFGLIAMLVTALAPRLKGGPSTAA